MVSTPAVSNDAAPAVGEAARPTYRVPFAIMTILFFMWGFMTVWNDILIPRFKEAFTLNYFQAMLVQLAFFGAYAIGSLIYFVVSIVSGDPINRIGYKNGVVLGLLVSAVGTALFYPAASATSYVFFLAALFIVGLGFAMLQIAANPYVTILGPERTASSRLNLSQAFNSLGTTIGPVIAGWLIYEVFSQSGVHGADSVKIPYLCVAGVFLVLAVLFKSVHLPSFTNTEKPDTGLGALKYPHTVLGMVAIFMYVGGEVAIGSGVINFLGLDRVAGLSPQDAAPYLAFYWGGLMIGRFMGAFALSDLRAGVKNTLVVATPLVAMAVIVVASGFHRDPIGVDLAEGFHKAYPYCIMLAVLPVVFLLGEASPHRMLALFGGVIIALLTTGVLNQGKVAQWSVLGVGLFCSVMWSNIFSLAIDGLGPLKSQASSLLVMAILGGAVLPPIQGRVADAYGIQASFVVPAVAFAYVVFYGLYGYRAGRSDDLVN